MIGRRVRVPFGARAGRLVVGTGTAEPGTPELRAGAGRARRRAAARRRTARLAALAGRYTHAPLGEVLATALPAVLRPARPCPTPHAWAWRLTDAGATALPRLRAGTPAASWPTLPGTTAPATRTQLDEAARRLARRGAQPGQARAGRAHRDARRRPRRHRSRARRSTTSSSAADRGDHRPPTASPRFLLDGVTGSGKTEVYLQAIARLPGARQAGAGAGAGDRPDAADAGALPRAPGRAGACAAFGPERQRARARLGGRARAARRGWWSARARRCSCRCRDAGLIVVDEEHDGSYKQQDGIRYHARDFALVRGKALGVPVVLGSATPSLESLHNARAGRYAHLRLTQRAGVARPPRVRVLDVRKRPLRGRPVAGTAGRDRTAPGRRRPGAGVQEPPRLRAGAAVPRLRLERAMPALRRSRTHDRARAAAAACSATTAARAGRRRSPAPIAAAWRCSRRASAPSGWRNCWPQRFPDVPVMRIDRGSTRRRDALEALAGQARRRARHPGRHADAGQGPRPAER